MPLIEEMERTGGWLFRWRSFLPVFIFPAALYVAFMEGDSFYFNSTRWFYICFVVSLLGLIIRVFTIAYVPKGTSGRNTSEGQVALTLNSTGMYGYMRHPLYTGNYFIWLGIAMFTGDFFFTVAVSVSFWGYYTLIAMTEERYLRMKFGQDYLDWASGTPAFFPLTLKWRSPGVFFSLRNVLKREYNGAYAMIISFVSVDGAHTLRNGLLSGLEFPDTLLLSPFMQYVLFASTCAFLVLRLIKKRTKFLDVDGREYT